MDRTPEARDRQPAHQSRIEYVRIGLVVRDTLDTDSFIRRPQLRSSRAAVQHTHHTDTQCVRGPGVNTRHTQRKANSRTQTTQGPGAHSICHQKRNSPRRSQECESSQNECGGQSQWWGGAVRVGAKSKFLWDATRPGADCATRRPPRATRGRRRHGAAPHRATAGTCPGRPAHAATHLPADPARRRSGVA